MRSIYTISCPDTGNVFYVGATKDLEKRAIFHINCDASYATHKPIQEILSRGKIPVFTEIEIVDKGWAKIEMAWIKFHIEKGCILVNTQMDIYLRKKEIRKSIIKLDLKNDGFILKEK